MSSQKFESLADQYLEIKVWGESELMAQCPFCEGRSSLQVNVNSGLWLCFKCSERGTFETLVKKLGGRYIDPIVSAEHIRGRIERIRSRKLNAEKKVKKEVVGIDESSLLRYSSGDDYWIERRGFSKDTVKKFQLGYDPIFNRHIIPYRSPDGVLLGVIQRKLSDGDGPRYLYPEGFSRKDSLFGSWAVGVNGSSSTVALVEGSTDVLALDGICPALAQYGSGISSGQVRLLHRLNIREVILFYDYDEAGIKAELRSREMIDGIVIRSVTYDPNKYCWHKKLCGCKQGHSWKEIGKCPKKVLCTCGRKHGVDPGSLSTREKKRMVRNARLVGTKQRNKKQSYLP